MKRVFVALIQTSHKSIIVLLAALLLCESRKRFLWIFLVLGRVEGKPNATRKPTRRSRRKPRKPLTPALVPASPPASPTEEAATPDSPDQQVSDLTQHRHTDQRVPESVPQDTWKLMPLHSSPLRHDQTYPKACRRLVHRNLTGRSNTPAASNHSTQTDPWATTDDDEPILLPGDDKWGPIKVTLTASHISYREKRLT